MNIYDKNLYQFYKKPNTFTKYINPSMNKFFENKYIPTQQLAH